MRTVHIYCPSSAQICVRHLHTVLVAICELARIGPRQDRAVVMCVQDITFVAVT